MLAFMLLVDGQQRPAGREAVVEKGSGRASLTPAEYKWLLIAKCSGNLCNNALETCATRKEVPRGA